MKLDANTVKLLRQFRLPPLEYFMVGDDRLDKVVVIN